MALTIGEITNEVELTGAATPPGPPATDAAAAPEWVRRAAHRALCAAMARDVRRTTVEDRDV